MSSNAMMCCDTSRTRLEVGSGEKVSRMGRLGLVGEALGLGLGDGLLHGGGVVEGVLKVGMRVAG